MGWIEIMIHGLIYENDAILKGLDYVTIYCLTGSPRMIAGMMKRSVTSKIAIMSPH